MTASSRLLLSTGLIAATALLAACDRVGSPFDAIGGDVPPPDEFAVERRAPLRMPPAIGLPEPRPGAPSPLDPRPRQEAAMALLGTPTPAAAGQRMTAAEVALLQSADAAAASEEVRVQLAQDRARGDEAFDPPSIFELFGGRSAIPEGERLEPAREAQRMQRAGVPAPADPLAVPPEAAEVAADPTEAAPPVRTFGATVRSRPPTTRPASRP